MKKIFESLIIRFYCLFLSDRERIIATHSLNQFIWPDVIKYRPKNYDGWCMGNRVNDYSWLYYYLDKRIKDKRANEYYHIVEYSGHDEIFFESWMELKSGLSGNEYSDRHMEMIRDEEGRKVQRLREEKLNMLL